MAGPSPSSTSADLQVSAAGFGARRHPKTKNQRKTFSNQHTSEGGNGGTPPHQQNDNDRECSYVSLDVDATRDMRHPVPRDRWAITIVTRPSCRYISRSKTGPCDILPFPAQRAQGDARNGIASEIRAWIPGRVRDISRISPRRVYHAGTSVWRG